MGLKHLSILVSVCSLFFFLLFSCDGNDTARINGHAENVKGKKLYLERIEPTRTRLLDSASVGSNGDFSFKLQLTSNEPYFVTLKTDSLLLATLLVEKGEKVNVEYVGGTYRVEGSEGSALVKELNDKAAITARKRDSLLQIPAPLAFTDTMAASVNHQLARLLVEQKRSNIRFIAEHPKSYASIMAIYQNFSPELPLFGRAEDLPYYRLLADSLQASYPNTAYVEAIKAEAKKLEQEMALQARLSNAEVIEGLPDISLPDENGRQVSLSSLKGNVVLLTFWSSTMQGSQLDNRELVNIYNKYHAKGFEVYQVSLDPDRNIWMKAVETQQLPWINVCDGQGTSSYAARQYNVQSIPYCYLLSKTGEPVGKNIFGAALDKKLAELCK